MRLVKNYMLDEGLHHGLNDLTTNVIAKARQEIVSQLLTNIMEGGRLYDRV